jgi:hypothetical protein
VSPTYTIESICAVTLVPLLIIALTLAGYYFVRCADRMDDDIDAPVARGFGIASYAGALLAALCLAWGMYPWTPAYHQWQPRSGDVAQIDSRLLAASGKFVVIFAGDPQQYGVNDTRGANVEAGDHLTITCVKRWQYAGTDSFDCNFVQLDKRPA